MSYKLISFFFRHTYNCNTQKYYPNRKGYTVLCYGWSTDTTKKHFSWNLIFVTLREHAENQHTIKDTHLEAYTLTMNYIPKINQQIFSCNIVIQQDTLLTFRLSTSHETTKVLLKCLRNNKLYGKICGNGNIILPAVFLKCDDLSSESDFQKSSTVLKHKRSVLNKSAGHIAEGRKLRETKSDKTSTSSKINSATNSLRRLSSREAKLLKKETTYVIEASVLDNSWPLSRKEWKVVKSLKERALIGKPSMSLQKIKSVVFILI